MTTLPSRLRESAKVLRALHGVVTVSNRIAAELTEAADALEAGRGEPVAWRVRGHAFDFNNTDEPRLWHYYTGSRRPTVGVPYRCDIEPLYAAPVVQVTQEGDAGVDACATCGGALDGVPGNENLVDGKPMCDYCHSDLIRTHGVATDQPNREDGRV